MGSGMVDAVAWVAWVGACHGGGAMFLEMVGVFVLGCWVAGQGCVAARGDGP